LPGAADDPTKPATDENAKSADDAMEALRRSIEQDKTRN
jgi:hypothetical protein